MEGCIFCRIIEGEMESEIIHETKNVVSFLDVNPRSPGHSLVIPKEHAETFLDLKEEYIGELFTAVREVEKKLDKALNPDAFTIGINDGEAAGQEIPHLHVNIIPRYERDQGKPIHSVVKNAPEKEITEIAEIIRSEEG